MMQVATYLKSSFSEKATKIWKNLPFVLTLMSKNNRFVKTGGRFFQIFSILFSILSLTNALGEWCFKWHHAAADLEVIPAANFVAFW